MLAFLPVNFALLEALLGQREGGRGEEAANLCRDWLPLLPLPPTLPGGLLKEKHATSQAGFVPTHPLPSQQHCKGSG